MLTIRSVSELREALAERGPVALVPTLGALHDGHRALLAAAGDDQPTVVLSIFVNPTQFGGGEDYEAYPRDETADSAVAHAAGVDVVFAPSVDEVYPAGFATTVDPGPVAEPLCGAFRPGHFKAVATVVTKLLGMVRPATAWFGAKDWQQLLVIRRVASDLDTGVAIRHVATVRDADGLALSSRNAYLDAGDRRRAASLSAALRTAAARYGAGERNGAALLAAAHEHLAIEPEYLDLRERDSLADYDPARPAVLAVAARVGPARLIDNIHLVPEEHT